MKVLLIGSGGREHALAWKIKQSPKVAKLFVAPGNGGTSKIAENIDIKDTEIKKLADFAENEKIGLTVVGPEVPLNLGIVDEFEKRNLRIFGPNKEAAKIEGSKAWCKGLLQKYNIPCGMSKTFTDPDKAKEYLAEFAKGETLGTPIVLKASGLAAGKGVLICKTREESIKGIDQILVNKDFGDAGNEMIIEEFLEGTEVSVLAFTDGKTIVPMVPACDYKRAYDNDRGLNTGGMGVYSPPGFYTQELNDKIIEKLLEPTLEALNIEGINYKGILYAGVILTDGGPKLLEYNCRFGDPETQVVLPRLKTDIVEIFESVIDGNLGSQKIDWSDKACVGVVLASGGYPEKYEIGHEITGINDITDAIVFHAGTKSGKDQILSNGGRVLCISALGKDIDEARTKVYDEIKKVDFKNKHYRKDIALREVNPKHQASNSK